MAETRAGGVYFVRGAWVDANGKETDAPTVQEGDRATTDPGSRIETDGEGNDVERPMPYAGLLADAGYAGYEAVRDASDDELLAIEGIGPARLAEIRAFR